MGWEETPPPPMGALVGTKAWAGGRTGTEPASLRALTAGFLEESARARLVSGSGTPGGVLSLATDV